MSIRKNKKEIERLIKTFEIEAEKFHDIKFSTFFTYEENTLNQEFEQFNHTIQLWSYYGGLESNGGIEKFMECLKTLDSTWGFRNTELSLFGIIEGKQCDLFVRMAKRAGSLFNKKEANEVSVRIVNEFTRVQNDKIFIGFNSNPLSVWLNYLLYYTSTAHPVIGEITRIEPDPFALSLRALEQLLHTPKIEKENNSLTKIENIKFKIALSFPGEKRDYVSKVVELLKVDIENIFYDLDYQAQLARPNLDTILQNVYRNNAELIVVFLCSDYSKKEWCGLEWRAIRDIIKSKEDDRIMLIRFDDSKIEGVFSIDGYIDANKYPEVDVSKFILERLKLLA